jgi:hypothetical protein
MSNNEIVVQGSFYGIRGELLKRVFLLIAYGIIFFITNQYRKSFYYDNGITSASTFLAKKLTGFNFSDILPLLIIILIFIFITILTFSCLFKTIKLFYNINRKITVDFFQGKIVMVSYRFPFFKNVEQDKFDNIITVNIEQSFMDRFFNTGKLYIEYLVSSKVDSSSVSFEIPHVYRPSKALKELLR